MHPKSSQSLLHRGLHAVPAILLVALAGFVAASPVLARPNLTVSAGGPYNGTVGQPIQFRATVTGATGPSQPIVPTVIWNFGDGGVGSGPSPSHIYRNAGNFTATVTVSAGADSGTDSAPVTVRGAPQPGFTVSATASSPGTVGQPVQFTASPAGPGDLSRLAYNWDFGDGSAAAARNPTHTYSLAGTYVASVIATDGNSVATDTVTVVVNPAGPSFAVSAGGPYSGFTNQPVQFNAVAAVPLTTTPITFSWTFGDGGTAIGSNPRYTYARPGVYTVTLTGTSGTTTSQDTTTATITAAPVTPLTVNAGGPYTGTVGQPVTLTAQTNIADASLTFTWDFGDGVSGAGSTVSHTYQLQGTYIATVVAVSGATGAAAGNTASVTIGPAAPTGPSVSYAAGWNLVGGPGGSTFPQANGPLYTFQAGNTAYQSIPNTQGIVGGQGYWAFFTAQTTVTFAGDSTSPITVQAPANQYIMVGNPSVTGPATVTGADVVYVWDATGGAYASQTTIAPGRGAWALRSTAGSVTITPSSTGTSTPSPTPSLIGPLYRWQQTVLSTGQSMTPPNPSSYTLQLAADGTAAAQADCNRASGTYTVSGSSLNLNFLATTLAACLPGSLGDQYLQQLNSVTSFSFQGTQLILQLPSNQGAMLFAQ
jgi:PKD repeat protein/heat shock protein HslJ